MKRSLLFLGALTFSLPAPVALQSPAAAQNRSEITEFCKADVPLNPPATVGDCVSHVNTLVNGSPGLTAQTCDFFMTLFPEIFFGAYASYDECIRDDAQNLPSL
jgi:hypothetical protein